MRRLLPDVALMWTLVACGADPQPYIADGAVPDAAPPIVDASVIAVDASPMDASGLDAPPAPDAAVPPDAAPLPDAALLQDSCSIPIVSVPGFSACSTDAECTGGKVCSPYSNGDGPVVLVCETPCVMIGMSHSCPESSLGGCANTGPSGIWACTKLVGPTDALDCCDGSDSNGNGYVDESACDPSGLGCYGFGWCGSGGACVDGMCL